VIIADVPEESQAVTEETFGPTLTVARVASPAEGVERANSGRYGLGGTVFAGRYGRCPRAAQRHDGDQLGHLVRQHPGPAIRRLG